MKAAISSLLVALLHPLRRVHQSPHTARSNPGNPLPHTLLDQDYCLQHRGSSVGNEGTPNRPGPTSQLLSILSHSFLRLLGLIERRSDLCHQFPYFGSRCTDSWFDLEQLNALQISLTIHWGM
ncbi:MULTISPECIES: hypothetical protein [Cupriavidus]|uniref:hypothetical protein n=1 Tax=Cupriavidus alkaliphilus TaxID=942866 RepID=UPI0016223CB8|nr:MULTISPECIES: hypothetical protein [Cupriavidus]MBB3015980.1 hypothetical protein [Cupriavidus alkaliphilus]